MSLKGRIKRRVQKIRSRRNKNSSGAQLGEAGDIGNQLARRAGDQQIRTRLSSGGPVAKPN